MIGIFFGSFDPPHIGHVNIVTAALNSSIVDKVIVVPAYKSVWKNTETKWEYRLTMAKETFDNIPGVVVDGIEYRIANGEPLPTEKERFESLRLHFTSLFLQHPKMLEVMSYKDIVLKAKEFTKEYLKHE